MNINDNDALRIIKEEVFKLLAEQTSGWRELEGDPEAAIAKGATRQEIRTIVDEMKVDRAAIYKEFPKETLYRQRRAMYHLSHGEKVGRYGRPGGLGRQLHPAWLFGKVKPAGPLEGPYPEPDWAKETRIDPTTQKVISGAKAKFSRHEQEDLDRNQTRQACSDLRGNLRPLRGRFPQSATDPLFTHFLRRVNQLSPPDPNVAGAPTADAKAIALLDQAIDDVSPGRPHDMIKEINKAVAGVWKFEGCHVEAICNGGGGQARVGANRVDFCGGRSATNNAQACWRPHGGHHETTSSGYARLVSKYNMLSPEDIMKSCHDYSAYGGQGVDRDKFIVKVDREYLLAKKEVIPGLVDTPLATFIETINAGLADITGTSAASDRSDPVEIYGLYYLDFFVGLAVRWDFHNVSFIDIKDFNEEIIGVNQLGEDRGVVDRGAEQNRGVIKTKNGNRNVFRVAMDKNGEPMLPVQLKKSPHMLGQACQDDADCRDDRTEAHDVNSRTRCMQGACYEEESRNDVVFRQGYDNLPGLTRVVEYIEEVTQKKHEENIHRILPADDISAYANNIVDPRYDAHGRQDYGARGTTRSDHADLLGKSAGQRLIFNPDTGEYEAPPARGGAKDPDKVLPWYRRIDPNAMRDY